MTHVVLHKLTATYINIYIRKQQTENIFIHMHTSINTYYTKIIFKVKKASKFS